MVDEQRGRLRASVATSSRPSSLTESSDVNKLFHSDLQHRQVSAQRVPDQWKCARPRTDDNAFARHRLGWYRGQSAAAQKVKGPKPSSPETLIHTRNHPSAPGGFGFYYSCECVGACDGAGQGIAIICERHERWSAINGQNPMCYFFFSVGAFENIPLIYRWSKISY